MQFMKQQDLVNGIEDAIEVLNGKTLDFRTSVWNPRSQVMEQFTTITFRNERAIESLKQTLEYFKNDPIK